LPELLATLSRGVEQLLVDTKPDAILVQGDTSTTFATALTAFYLGIPVVHLEAGLRTATIAQPFPEEAHRRLVAPITSLHLAPTEHAAAVLATEGYSRDSVVTTGNTVVDAFLIAAGLAVPFD